MLIKRVNLLYLIVTLVVLLSPYVVYADWQSIYSVDTWSDGLGTLGNHRIKVYNTSTADAVWAHILWRRRDPNPQDYGILLLDSYTGQTIQNMVPVNVYQEYGDIVFQPQTTPGYYDIYYMLYSIPTTTPDSDWLIQNNLTPDELQDSTWTQLPTVSLVSIQSRTDFDQFNPMEVIATESETTALFSQYPIDNYLVYPENRLYPIRMTNDLSYLWIVNGLSTIFSDTVEKDEFYTFQLGVYAMRTSLGDVIVQYTDLTSSSGYTISSSLFQCINTSGVDWLGRNTTFIVNVTQGEIQPLWVGLQIPKNTRTGLYYGSVIVAPQNAEPKKINLTLYVMDSVIANHGTNDLWRQSRLSWLNSSLEVNYDIPAPYTPLVVSGNTVSCLNRSVQFGESGLPKSIQSNNTEILAGPIEFIVETTNGLITWVNKTTEFTNISPDKVKEKWKQSGGPFRVNGSMKMEFDGYIYFSIKLTATDTVHVQDIRLEIPYRKKVATYMMGMACQGGYRPSQWIWNWNINEANNALWIGDVNEGLRCELKGSEYEWDLYNLLSSGLPPSWNNNGYGGCTVTEDSTDVIVSAYSGNRDLQKGDELEFDFSLLVTPLKSMDTSRWQYRFYYSNIQPQTAIDSGANITEIHQGYPENPYINYPFWTIDTLSTYIYQAHQDNLKVLVYYTIRELSTRTAELWALRSLNFEILNSGSGGGYSWLQEHLVTDYTPGFLTDLSNGEEDASIADIGLSRWDNYYVEGLDWVLQNTQIDGLYLDGIGYDREIMKRVRKVLDRSNPGSLIDMHSGNNYIFYGVSPANQYMELFPYLNSLWFGEYYDYNNSPDYWLVEISGIPFGLPGSMLQMTEDQQVYPWRGMLYGMTSRYYNYNNGSDYLKPLWQLWDNFGIQTSKMIGYWDPACPVTTSDTTILATVYSQSDKALISLASWSDQTVYCQLKINWKSLGLQKENCVLYAPPILDFQSENIFSPDGVIPIEPGEGWLLILENNPSSFTREWSFY
jgi:hypothetical protein